MYYRCDDLKGKMSLEPESRIHKSKEMLRRDSSNDSPE
jgi:hypothetical protein